MPLVFLPLALKFGWGLIARIAGAALANRVFDRAAVLALWHRVEREPDSLEADVVRALADSLGITLPAPRNGAKTEPKPEEPAA